MGWVDNAPPEVDAESQYPMIIAICATLSILSISIVCARLWIRYKNHGLAADDWMAILSMFFALLYSILCIVRTYPRHQSIYLHPPTDRGTQRRNMASACH